MKTNEFCLRFHSSLFLINNILALVQIMTWCRPGDKPLSEPMMVNLLTHSCVTRPQWLNANIHTCSLWKGANFNSKWTTSTLEGIWILIYIKQIYTFLAKLAKLNHNNPVFSINLNWCFTQNHAGWVTPLLCHHNGLGSSTLTHLPLDNMATISQTTFSNAFSWMNYFVFWFNLH